MGNDGISALITSTTSAGADLHTLILGVAGLVVAATAIKAGALKLVPRVVSGLIGKLGG